MPRPVHFEIPAHDVGRATSFFSNVFGWQFQGWGDGDYQIATTGEESEMGINGAVFKAAEARQPIVNSIGVASIDSMVSKITAHGGAMIQAKQPVPGMGWYATFKDTEGNLHGLWESDQAAK